MAGWGLGQGRGPGEGGCRLGPSSGGKLGSPRRRGFLLQSKPRLCRPGAGVGAGGGGETGRGGERGSHWGFFLEETSLPLACHLLCHGFLSLLFFSSCLAPLWVCTCIACPPWIRSGHLQLKSFSPCASLLSVSPSNLVRWSLGSLPYRCWPHGHGGYYRHNI